MSVSKPIPSYGPEYHVPQPFPVYRYLLEYLSCLDASCSTDMLASDTALNFRDHQNVLQHIKFSPWVKRQLHCNRRGMFVSRCTSFKVDCPIFAVMKRLNINDQDRLTLFWRCVVHPLTKLGPLLVKIILPSSHLYFAELFFYWTQHLDSELPLPGHSGKIFPGWHEHEWFAIPTSHCLNHFIQTLI